MIVTINGEQISTAKGTVSISGSIGERSTCSFTIVDIDGSKHFISPEKAMEIENALGAIDSGVSRVIITLATALDGQSGTIIQQ